MNAATLSFSGGVANICLPFTVNPDKAMGILRGGLFATTSSLGYTREEMTAWARNPITALEYGFRIVEQEGGSVDPVASRLLFCGRDSDALLLPSGFGDAGTEAGNQENFHDGFTGIIIGPADGGRVLVATRGLWLVSTPTGALETGDLMGIDEAASGTAMLNAQVAVVAGANLAVGQIAYGSPAGVLCCVEIVSTEFYGGPQAAA